MSRLLEEDPRPPPCEDAVIAGELKSSLSTWRFLSSPPTPSRHVPLTQRRDPLPGTPPTRQAPASPAPPPSLGFLVHPCPFSPLPWSASTTFSYANTNPKKEKSWGGGSGAGGGLWRQNQRGGHMGGTQISITGLEDGGRGHTLSFRKLERERKWIFP